MKKDTCALVLGGYVNGYSIIRELHEKKVEDIILFDTTRSLASYSNKIKKFFLIDNTPESLYNALGILNQEYHKIIIFPTEDLQLEYLYKLNPKIEHFCFLPLNSKNIMECLDKYYQYSFCEKLGIPYPKTVQITHATDIEKIADIQYPILIKPTKRNDLKLDVFRNLQLDTNTDLEKNTELIKGYLNAGISFIASEVIPGDGSNIYAYVGYRSKAGEILNEWTGKKLAQFPNDFGVFASASNQAPDIVRDQGRALLNGMDLIGIAEAEFKYDHRDGKYKLMEINLRSTMWHRVGNLSGVNIQYTQYLDAIGKKASAQQQDKNTDIHFVYFKHELYNLLMRPNYLHTFYNNIFRSGKTHFAVFNVSDIIPCIIDVRNVLRRVIRGEWS
jgi:D-aspartate ligase